MNALDMVQRNYADDRNSRRETVRKEVAEESLRERFARGEIDEAELGRMLRALRESRSSA